MNVVQQLTPAKSGSGEPNYTPLTSGSENPWAR